ncbi:PREDICTED: guanine nucleotide-binding protein G(I)/G(S)/G(O) subunit gamma-10 [Calidris pugnax]|uniref:guanine nucleotide-binding protein G(I)/G(S)/G(O) subunit gamma-10 n=1 Tax=Calidris pugnax TaxID=198806 RepID=UPI00071D88EA|nr:PREDICTED: guanine nucleotide-binding protein G(I)/G(S)/G(O) subunit gamma-10 [Calidris pugnax]
MQRKSSEEYIQLVKNHLVNEFPLWICFPFSLTQVSQAAAELQQYCMQNACKDALLVGVPAGSNPFREPRSCALL